MELRSFRSDLVVVVLEHGGLVAAIKLHQPAARWKKQNRRATDFLGMASTGAFCWGHQHETIIFDQNLVNCPSLTCGDADLDNPGG